MVVCVAVIWDCASAVVVGVEGDVDVVGVFASVVC